MASATLAIVIPVGTGDRAWERLLPMLWDASARQIVLAATREDKIERVPPGITLIRSDAGRATQQNAGAGATRADWLWFLHADSVVDPTSIARLWRFIDANERAIGHFDLRFDDGPIAMRLNEWGARLRSRWLKQPFGDQGFVMPSGLFFDLGGFDASVHYGEDHALIWTARRRGIRIVPVGAQLGTSSRKYIERGWWPTTRHHLVETALQTLRFSQKRPRR